MKDLYKKASPAIFTCLPDNVQGPENCDFRALVYLVIGYIEEIIIVIFALSVLVFLWGVFKYIFLSGGDEKQMGQARDVIFYGIIGLFVMVSVWGIVNVLQNTFFGS